ncbi:MAG: ATP-binding protein [Bacteroidales bacterium]|nr:ATP-binding protein [Bacteroidales bacterium]
MNYEIDKKSLTSEQRMWLDNLNTGLIAELQRSVNVNGRSTLSLVPTVAVTARKAGEAFLKIESNASFSISGSLAVGAEAKKWLEAHTEADPDGFALRVKLSFAAKEAPAPRRKDADDDKRPDFVPVKPRYTFDQIIIPDDTRRQIMDALAVVRHRELVYDTWGFSQCDPTPNSILSFYGPPGTGKTMCAHAIAAYLQKPLLAFNYAEIESKYVGEAAKNLKKAFATATEMDAVMFFDEADSFLGKRVENVQSGNDQSLNSQRSQMLILLEEFRGVVIFATNLQTNFDKAFESRILAHIKLDLPNREARAAILRGLMPERLPLAAPMTDDDLLAVSDKMEGLAGREIKQAVKQLLFRKAAEDGAEARISADDLTAAMEAKVTEKSNLEAEAEANKQRERERKEKAVMEGFKRDAERKRKYLDSMSLESLQEAVKRKEEAKAKEEAAEGADPQPTPPETPAEPVAPAE